MGWDDKNGNGGFGPWGSRDTGSKDSGAPKKPSGPRPVDDIPDLETVMRRAQERFGFGGGGRGAGPTGGHEGRRGIGLLVLVATVFWLATGFYRVEPGENAVVMTFGKATDTRDTPGLGYHVPWPVQAVIPVNVAFTRQLEIGFRNDTGEKSGVAGESRMLTGDENIVDIQFVVTWRIGDAKSFLFQIRDPETTVKKVAESAMREIIGRSEIQKAMTEGRADIEAKTKDLMQKVLESYHSGVIVNGVQLLRVDPPADVVDAFDDVQRARADMERVKNEAETYRNDIVPRARGDAQKLLQDAAAYKQAILSKAQGEAGRFDSVYAAYAAAKDVTVRRIYIETMQQIMQGSKKVLIGSEKAATVLPYLPLGAAPKPAPAQTTAGQ